MPLLKVSDPELHKILSQIDHLFMMADLETPPRIKNILDKTNIVADEDLVIVTSGQPYVLLEDEDEKDDEFVDEESLSLAEKEEPSVEYFTLNKAELSTILCQIRNKFFQIDADIENKKDDLKLLRNIFSIADAEAITYFLNEGHRIVIPAPKNMCLRLQAQIIAEAIAAATPEITAATTLNAIAKKDVRVLEMILRAANKPALPVELLETLLQEVVANPSDFSCPLIIIILQHLEKHTGWNNYNLSFGEDSLWPVITANPQLCVAIRSLTLPQYTDAIFSTCGLNTNRSVTRSAFSNVIESNRYDTYLMRRYIKNNGIGFALAWSKQLPNYFEFMPALDSTQLKNLLEFFKTADFSKQIAEDLDFHGILFWLRFTEEQHIQSNSTSAQLAPIQSMVANRLTALFAILPDELDEHTIKDITQLLDFLYADYNPVGFKKSLFKQAINQLLQKYSVDSTVLEDLKLKEKYGLSFSYGITYAMHFCERKVHAAKPGFFAALASASVSISEKLQELNPLSARPVNRT